MKPTRAVWVIALAIETGKLPDYTTVELHGRTVTVTLPRDYYRRSFTQEQVWVDWVKSRFPGGNERRGGLFKKASKARKVVASDRAEYHARLGTDALLVLRYVVPHEHRNYHGAIVDGKPKWACTGCGQAITITESRSLGLLPPIPAKEKK